MYIFRNSSVQLKAWQACPTYGIFLGTFMKYFAFKGGKKALNHIKKKKLYLLDLNKHMHICVLYSLSCLMPLLFVTFSD